MGQQNVTPDPRVFYCHQTEREVQGDTVTSQGLPPPCLSLSQGLAVAQADPEHVMLLPVSWMLALHTCMAAPGSSALLGATPVQDRSGLR